MLQSHAQRSEPGSHAGPAAACKSDIQQIYRQSTASELYPFALTQYPQLQVSFRWPGHSFGNTNTHQSQDTELSGPYIPYRQSASAPQETESLRLFLREVPLCWDCRKQDTFNNVKNFIVTSFLNLKSTSFFLVGGWDGERCTGDWRLY